MWTKRRPALGDLNFNQLGATTPARFPAAAIYIELILKFPRVPKGILKGMHGRPVMFGRPGQFVNDIVPQLGNLRRRNRTGGLLRIDFCLPQDLINIDIS